MFAFEQAAGSSLRQTDRERAFADLARASGDVWHWDGDQWGAIAQDVFPPRQAFGLAYDAARILADAMTRAGSTDGEKVGRWLLDEMLAAAASGASPTRTVSPVDGVERIGAMQLVPDYPLAVIATIASLYGSRVRSRIDGETYRVWMKRLLLTMAMILLVQVAWRLLLA